MISYHQPNKLIIKPSSIHGLGVFATADIKAHELVERCPMVKLGWRTNYINDPAIWTYCYMQPKCDCNDCKNHGNNMWMVLGYGMLYNHQDIPNTSWSFKYDESYTDLVSTKDIKAGEEIFVSYGANYFKNRKKIDIANNKPLTTPTPAVELEDDETFMKKVAALLKDAQK